MSVVGTLFLGQTDFTHDSIRPLKPLKLRVSLLQFSARRSRHEAVRANRGKYNFASVAIIHSNMTLFNAPSSARIV